MPLPQQHQIQATSVTYTTAHGNTGSSTQTEQVRDQTYVIIDTSWVTYHWATTGTPWPAVSRLHRFSPSGRIHLQSPSSITSWEIPKQWGPFMALFPLGYSGKVTSLHLHPAPSSSSDFSLVKWRQHYLTPGWLWELHELIHACSNSLLEQCLAQSKHLVMVSIHYDEFADSWLSVH